MKILMLFAASAMSALVVLPTVSQAEIGGTSQQASKLADRQPGGMERQS